MDNHGTNLEHRLSELERELAGKNIRARGWVKLTSAMAALAAVAGTVFWTSGGEAQSPACAASVPVCFANGNVLQSQQLNQNFSALADRSAVTVFRQAATTDFTFNGLNTFTDLPDLDISFSLRQPAVVIVTYSVSGDSDEQAVVTNLLVDNTVMHEAASSRGAFFSLNGTSATQLSGNSTTPTTHRVRVRYRTPAATLHDVSVDYHERTLTVTVLGPATRL